MLSKEICAYAREAWTTARAAMGQWGDVLQKEVDELCGERRTLVELALGTLPASDAASVPVGVLTAYADHALFLRENSPYCRDIPEDIFLHCVYYPRINSEDLVECRRFFYDMLAEEVSGKTGAEAVLLVNRWCAAQMTYEMTDTRSINPVTAYYCGLGRCGEESTFGVTALRSVGIPARQIYVPWWSHCDDNHAWVEAYVDGEWHFLGACEPEPALDRGWFVNASSRAMVVCSRNYFDFVGEGLKREGLIQKKGICLAYNQIHRYAEASPVTVKVADGEGQPLCGAWVRLYVENMASHALIAARKTDENGCVQVELGHGSCLVEAEYGGLFAWTTISVEGAVELTLTPEHREPVEGTVFWDHHAPVTGHRYQTGLTAEEQQEKAQITADAKRKRISRISGYWSERYETGDPELDRVFHIAGGNAEALWQFYSTYGSEGRDMLLSLAEKDWRDADPAVLSAHIEASRRMNSVNDPDHLPYIRCPRIGYELLTDFRKPVEAFLSTEQKEHFRRDPDDLWRWICENFREGSCRWHPVLWLQPEAALRLQAADQRGRRLLFVAILRTLGIPARLDPIDGRAQFRDGHDFRTVEAEKAHESMAAVHIHAEHSMTYGESWCMSRWCGGWQPLDLESADIQNLRLPLGLYCLHTVNRLPSGDQLVSLNTFSLKTDMDLHVEKRHASAEQLLADFQVDLPVPVEGLTLQLYLEPSAEPTEHSLNELTAAADRISMAMDRGLALQLILPDDGLKEDPTLQKTLAALPRAVVLTEDFHGSALETLARALYLEPGAWPLMTLTDGETAYYGQGGYAVGSVGLAIELAERLQTSE